MILERQKRVAAIHDVSGIGKCSLTVAVPVLSAAGIEAAVMPTAVLSTHTGDIKGFTYRDLTSDMPAIAAHWKDLGVKFDGIFSGFLQGQNESEKRRRGAYSHRFRDGLLPLGQYG